MCEIMFSIQKVEKNFETRHFIFSQNQHLEVQMMLSYREPAIWQLTAYLKGLQVKQMQV